ncbi:MAG: XisI protein [Cyanobacteria bacterium SBLK]|nr:XisI protein [Cyanobacteria bacterium SBLK]
MDRLDLLQHYRQCVKKLLKQHSQGQTIGGDIEVQTVFDTESDRYLLVSLGWDKYRRIYNCEIHLEIRSNKIWIQRNQTDRLIAHELVEMGVLQEDIILGLQPEYIREYTKFGVA